MENKIVSQRVAHNTIMLYMRQILIMIINLYLVRQVLVMLGQEDYGIYTVVAGIVTMFNILSSSMSQASQRFFSYDIGRNDIEQLNKNYSISLIVYIIIGIIILLLTETIGVWYVVNKLSLPDGKLEVAVFVFQVSILTLLVTIIAIPYIALVLAYEDMKIYAFISIGEVVLKLVLVIGLKYVPDNKLRLYSLSLLIVSSVVTITYVCVKKYKYRKVKFIRFYDKRMFSQLISFACWNMFGSAIYPLKIQGINIILNQTFGPIVVTARGVAAAVNSAVTSFYMNFGNAVRPQIIKSYAIGSEQDSLDIVYTSSKMTYFLMYIIMYPFIMEMDTVLKLWLVNVPIYAVIFSQLTLIDALIESISNPLMALIDSTGKIKMYQLVVGGIQLLNLPLSYVMINIFRSPISVYIIAIVLAVFSFIARIKIVSSMTGFKINVFIKDVVIRVLVASIIPGIIMSGVKEIIQTSSYWYLLCYIPFELIILVSFWIIALDNKERTFIKSFFKLKSNGKKSII